MLVGNWYENAENHATGATTQRLLGLGAPFRGEATTAASQQSEVGVGVCQIAQSLVAASRRMERVADLRR